MEINAALMLHSEDLAVNDYLFLYMCAFVCEKPQIVLLSTFVQGEVFLLKNENHPRGSFDSLNKAFGCTDYNAKTQLSTKSNF